MQYVGVITPPPGSVGPTIRVLNKGSLGFREPCASSPVVLFSRVSHGRVHLASGVAQCVSRSLFLGVLRCAAYEPMNAGVGSGRLYETFKTGISFVFLVRLHMTYFNDSGLLT